MTMPRILVADGEAIAAQDLCSTLSEAGYLVDGPHADLSSAMLALQKCKPELAILDVSLNDGDTFELAKRLQGENVLVMFHSDQAETVKVNEQFPHARFCTKPCPPSEILRIIEQALARD